MDETPPCSDPAGLDNAAREGPVWPTPGEESSLTKPNTQLRSKGPPIIPSAVADSCVDYLRRALDAA